MKTMVSKQKMSKKAKKQLDQQKRVTWGFSPTSRIKPSKKVYRRERIRPQDHRGVFLFSA